MGVMSFSGWHPSFTQESQVQAPPPPPQGLPWGHMLLLGWNTEIQVSLPPPSIPGTLTLAFGLISSVGKISSACLRFRFNWPRMSFSLPDFQSLQDLIIKEPPYSTCPGGSIFFFWKGWGVGSKLGTLPQFYNCSRDNIFGEDPDHARAVLPPTPPHEARPTLCLLAPLITDYHQEVRISPTVPYTKDKF